MRTLTIRRMIGRACGLACLYVAVALLGALEGILAMGALFFDPSSAGRLGGSAVPLYRWLEARLLPRQTR
jgi:hypothetical protein